MLARTQEPEEEFPILVGQGLRIVIAILHLVGGGGADLAPGHGFAVFVFHDPADAR